MKQKYYYNNNLSFKQTLFLLLCNSNHVVFFRREMGEVPKYTEIQIKFWR